MIDDRYIARYLSDEYGFSACIEASATQCQKFQDEKGHREV